MLKVAIILSIYLLGPVLIIEAYKRWKPVKTIGTVLIAYAIGIVMALCGLTAFPEESAGFGMQKTIMNVAVPLAIPLMLFNCDFKLWTKALPKTIWSLVGGIVAVVTAVFTGFLVFRNQGIPSFDKVSAMLTGIYTGGTMNFNALGAALKVEHLMPIVLAFQMVITTPYILFILAGGYKIYRKMLPYDDVTHRGRFNDNSQVEAKDDPVMNDLENYRGMFAKKNVGGMFAGLGISVLFLAIGAGLAKLITGELNELIIILTITTLSIIASFSEKIRRLPKTFELGMFFILIFSIVVASKFDPYNLARSYMMIGAFVLWIVLVSSLLHLVFCRVAKVSGDLFTVSQIALLCSPPFVPPVVGAMKNKRVLISGIVVGLVGYAIGTYLGLLIAWIL